MKKFAKGFLLLLLVFSLFSCDSDKIEDKAVKLTTPGVVGRVSLPKGVSVNASDVWVQAIGADGSQKSVQANSDGSFSMSGLNAKQSYTLFFTTKSPSSNVKAVTKGWEQGFDEGNKGGNGNHYGWDNKEKWPKTEDKDVPPSDGYGTKIDDVVPQTGDGFNVETVAMKPSATVAGYVILEGALDNECYGIDVYIPGTSFMAKTDDSGKYAISNVPEGTYNLRFEKDGYASIKSDSFTIVSNGTEHPVVAMDTVMLSSDSGIVKGIVHLAGCADFSTVTAKLEPTTNGNFTDITSVDGSYEIVGVKPGTYSLVLMKDGFVSARIDNVVVEASKTTEISQTVTLVSNGSDIKGKVTCGDGASAAGILITAKCSETDVTPAFSYTASTDSNGSYTISKCYPGTYTITITKTGYLDVVVENVEVVTGIDANVADKVLLSQFGRIAGKILANNNEKTTGAVITAVRVSDSKQYTSAALEDGTFEIGLMEAGSYNLTVSKAGFTAVTENGINVVAGTSTTVNDISMNSLYGTIKATVSYSGSDKKDGIKVSVYDGSQLISTATTSNSLTVVLNNIPVKAGYKIEAEADGYATSIKENVTVGSALETVITVPALASNFGSIKGIITDSKNNPIVGAQVKVGQYSLFTDSTGSFTKTGLAIGDYDFEVTCNGYTTLTLGSNVQITSGNETVVPTQKLTCIYGVISGKVTISGSQDYSGVQVVASCTNPEKTLLATTNADGKYSFTNVVPGTYKVTLSKNGYTIVEKENVVVVADSTISVEDATLVASTGLVTGRIILEDSVDCSGTAILLTYVSDSNNKYSTTAASDGSYSINLVKPAEYTVEISKTNFITDKTQRITVEAGKTTTIGDVTLKSTTSTVKGVVTLSGAAGSEGITILLKNDSNSYNTTTEQNGSYILNKVLPGTYTMTISMPGYVGKTIKDVTVATAVTKNMDSYALEIGTRSVVGSVSLELRTDYSGVLITATKTTDTTKVYSAITNTAGSYTLAGMESGEYSVVISCNGFNSITLPTVDVISGSQKTLDAQNLTIQRGTITGAVSLEGRTDHSGIKVKLIGTDYEMTTTSTGEYSFYVPQGNYSGVQFTKDDFETTTHTEQLALFAENKITLANETMTATHNTVYGKVDVRGTDDESAVTIKFINHPEITPIVTTADGNFSFASIPVGKYVLSFNRTNVPELQTSVEVKAANGIDVGTISLTPETASIMGVVHLQNGTNVSGVQVSVDMGSGDVLTATTDSSGNYYIGGISTAAVYTVTYSKEGWDSKSQSVGTKLTALEVRTLDSITLVDTTDPILNSVVINNGANSTGNRSVVVSLNVSERGSGVKYMRYSWNGNFELSEWVNYESSFSCEIPENVSQNINGLRSVQVQVKDAAGNVSTVEGDSISLIGQIQSVAGRLGDNQLHWTVENNPYVIASTIIVPEEKTLIIDPGVDVLFDGDYAIVIEGNLVAVGTESNPINFRTSKNYMSETYSQNVEGYTGYYGTWSGISASTNSLEFKRNGYDVEFVSGSRLSYCNLSDVGSGITGNLFIDHCTIDSNLYGIGSSNANFTGVLLNNKIKGSVKIFFDYEYKNNIVFGNTFEYAFDSTLFAKDNFLYSSDDGSYYWYNDESGSHGINIGFWFSIWYEAGLSHFVNNRVSGFPYVSVHDDYDYISFNTFASNVILDFGSNKNMIYNVFSNTLKSINISGNFYGANFNNFTNNSAEILLSCSTAKTEKSPVDFQYNYWGEVYTKVLKNAEKTNNYNIPFIYDGYSKGEASVNLKAVKWQNYVEQPWEFAGCQGDGLFDIEFAFIRQGTNGGEAKFGKDIDLDFKSLGNSEITEYRVAQSIEELLTEEWGQFYGTCAFKASDINLSLISKTGTLTLFAQAKNSNGEVSPVKSISLGYGEPIISNVSIEEGDVLSGDGLVAVRYTLSNSNPRTDILFYNKIYVDNEKIYDGNHWNYDYQSEVATPGIINLQKLKNGKHVLRIEELDAEVNELSVKEIEFIVNRLIPTVTEFEIDKTSVETGETIQANISLVNAKHLKEVRALSDEFVMFKETFNDNGAVTISNLVLTLDSRYVKTGSHVMYIETEDYAGNIARTEGRSFTANTESAGPSVSGLNITDSQVFVANQVETYNVNVSDVSGVKDICVSVGNSIIYQFHDDFFSSSYESIDVTLRFKVPNFANGDYNFVLEATDYAGNKTTISKSISVAKVLPTVTLSSISLNNKSLAGQIELSSASWIYDGRLMIDGIIQEYYLLYEARECSSWVRDFAVSLEGIPAGTHKLQAVFKTFGGDNVLSDECEITVERTVDNSKFGLSKTWNEDGNLITDSYIKLLWNFDDDGKEMFEKVSGTSIGSCNKTTEGIGKNGANIYINNDTNLIMPNSEWTVEFWSKNLDLTDWAYVEVRIYGIMDAYVYKRSSSTESYIGVNYNYESATGDTSGSRSVYIYDSSRTDRENWHHYAFTFDGSRINIFVDGILRGYQDELSVPNVGNGIYVYMYENAYIDELRISSRARTVDELSEYVKYVRTNSLLPND